MAYTDPLSFAVECLRVTLADSTAFRAWVGVADQTAALAKVFRHGPPPKPAKKQAYDVGELAKLRPYATVYPNPNGGYKTKLVSVSESFDYAANGSFTVLLYGSLEAEKLVGDEPTPDAIAAFETFLGSLIDDVWSLAGKGGYLAATSIDVTNGPYWTHPQMVPSEGHWIGAELTIGW